MSHPSLIPPGLTEQPPPRSIGRARPAIAKKRGRAPHDEAISSLGSDRPGSRGRARACLVWPPELVATVVTERAYCRTGLSLRYTPLLLATHYNCSADYCSACTETELIEHCCPLLGSSVFSCTHSHIFDHRRRREREACACGTD